MKTNDNVYKLFSKDCHHATLWSKTSNLWRNFLSRPLRFVTDILTPAIDHQIKERQEKAKHAAYFVFYKKNYASKQFLRYWPLVVYPSFYVSRYHLEKKWSRLLVLSIKYMFSKTGLKGLCNFCISVSSIKQRCNTIQWRHFLFCHSNGFFFFAKIRQKIQIKIVDLE